MSTSVARSAKSMHYAVSTFAAIVYGLVWLLANRAHAETSLEAPMPEVVVTAERDAVQTKIPEVVVWGTRVAAPDMPEVVVTAKREDDRRFAATESYRGAYGSRSQGSWLTKARLWVRTALVK